MSGPRFSIIPALAVTDTRLDGWALRVLALLGRHTDDQGWCIRSQGRMADELGVSRPLISRCVRDLVACGYVETISAGRVLRYRVRHDLSDAEIAEATEAAVATCQPADITPKQPVSPLTSRPDLSRPVTSDVTLRDTERPLINDVAAVASGVRARSLPERLAAAVNSPWLDPSKSPGLMTTGHEVLRWERQGVPFDEVMVPVVTALASRRTEPVTTWKYFTTAIRKATADFLAPDVPIEPATRTEPVHANNLRASQRLTQADVYATLAARARGGA